MVTLLPSHPASQFVTHVPRTIKQSQEPGVLVEMGDGKEMRCTVGSCAEGWANGNGSQAEPAVGRAKESLAWMEQAGVQLEGSVHPA